MIQYRDPCDPTRVCWKTFEDDIDQVFTIKVLKHELYNITGVITILLGVRKVSLLRGKFPTQRHTGASQKRRKRLADRQHRLQGFM